MGDALQLALGNRYGLAIAPTANNVALDATNDGAGWIFQAYTADAITHVGFRYGVRTGTPPTYRMALEAVDAAGHPDGTPLGGGTPASATFTPPADTTWNSTWQWVALANAYTPTRGAMLATTIRHSSGTVDGSNNSSVTGTVSSLATATWLRPYSDVLTAGVWTKSTGTPVFGIRTATRRYGIVFNTTYSTLVTTTGHRSAMRFRLPASWGATYTIAGARLGMTALAGGGTVRCGLWEGTTELQGVQIDTDELSSAASTRQIEVLFDEVMLVPLTCGTEYRIGLEVESSLDVALFGLQLAAAEDRLAYPFGAERGYSSWNGSAWADNDTVMPMLELILGELSEPTGSPTASRHASPPRTTVQIGRYGR